VGNKMLLSYTVEKLKKQKQHRRAVKNFKCCCVAYPQKRFHCSKAIFKLYARKSFTAFSHSKVYGKSLELQIFCLESFFDIKKSL